MLPHPGIEEKLREALHHIQAPDPAIQVQHRFEEGDAATVIVAVAESCGCDLIVMGTHGRTGLLHRLLMGSVAETVVRNAPCPVMTVKAPETESGSAGYEPDRNSVKA